MQQRAEQQMQQLQLQVQQANTQQPSYCRPSAHPMDTVLSTGVLATRVTEPVVCEFCGRLVLGEALALARHTCAEFMRYAHEFRAIGAGFALLISGVQHLPVGKLAAFMTAYPFARRVQHGAVFAASSGIFLLGPDGPMLARALLALGNVRMIPLNQSAQWRCLHVQLAPMYTVGHAEQVLSRELQRAMVTATGGKTATAGPHDTTPADIGDLAAAMPWALRTEGAPEHLASILSHLDAAPLAVGLDAIPGLNAVPASADWRCSTCSNINFAFRDKCNRCGVQRFGLRAAIGAAPVVRSICPFTVMLVRVPPQASETDVAEAMSMFGELARGIKFHTQRTKFKQQQFSRVAREGVVALHAFCRFVHASSATLALQHSEVLILSQPVLINPAFKRGPISTDMVGAIGAASSPDSTSPLFPPQRAARSSEWLAPPVHKPPSSDHCLVSPDDRGPGGSGHARDGGVASSWRLPMAALQLTSEPPKRELTTGCALSYLAVLFQALWFLDPLRQEVAALGRGNNWVADGLHMLLSSLYGTAPPLALLRAAFAPRVIDAACAAVGSVQATSNRFEAALGVLKKAGDQSLCTCLQQVCLPRAHGGVNGEGRIADRRR
jgi:hypothetical protein